MDPEAGGAQGPLPPLYHAGQPGPVSPGHTAVRPQLQRGLLPQVRIGGVGGRRGAGIRFLRRKLHQASAGGGDGAMVHLLRLRDGESRVLRAVGAQRRGLVPGGGILLRFPRPGQTEDRRGIRTGPEAAGGRPGDRLRGGRSVGGQLSGGPAAGGMAGHTGRKRRALRHPPDRRAAEAGAHRDRPGLPGRHPGVWPVLLG